ncbi:hypothetical protein [Brevibacillus agri]|uniref:hypothetical protein n=1 Tax=Brevibacillus agri TaxID=51101 RepID=UPI0018CE5337|nr:hypothetical protein [Brevibacillus agri]MBG9565783.1 hypothetical protein [Brevibacillus agri]
MLTAATIFRGPTGSRFAIPLSRLRHGGQLFVQGMAKADPSRSGSREKIVQSWPFRTFFASLCISFCILQNAIIVYW